MENYRGMEKTRDWGTYAEREKARGRENDARGRIVGQTRPRFQRRILPEIFSQLFATHFFAIYKLRGGCDDICPQLLVIFRDYS